MNRAKYERLERHLSQERVGWLAGGIPQPLISLLETGTWTPDADRLARIARVLHVDPPELLLTEVVPAESCEAAK